MLLHHSRKPVVLIPTPYYIPAFKAGGPIRSLFALCRELGDEYDFRILTSDRDLGDSRPFKDVSTGRWTPTPGGSVWYLSRRRRNSLGIFQAARNAPHDVLYLNSLFNPLFSLTLLVARRFGMLTPARILLAPRGELSPGALALKKRKKESFLRWACRADLFRGVSWHASTVLEKQEIQAATRRFPKLCPEESRIHVARDLAVLDTNPVQRNTTKQSGVLQAVFLSRISPKKNLAEAIRLAGQLKGAITLDIYGVIDAPDYWQECQRIAQSLANAVRVRYKGVVPHEDVLQTIGQYDVFVFPTQGENFGHVILESLLAGCPVLISDRTPWRGLEPEKAGWDLPLQERQRWVEVLQRLTDMDEQTYHLLRHGARALGLRASRDEQAVADNRALFEKMSAC